MAYLTLYPIGNAMHANLMVYRKMDDPWLRELRKSPEAALFSLMPRLRAITGEIEVVGPVKIRPADLYVTSGHRQDGIVIVGDAFATSCPAAGTGTDKVFTDVERLCNVHIPRWLASDGMSEKKIAAFYDDPLKTACDAWSTAKAYDLARCRPMMAFHGAQSAGRASSCGLVEGTLRKLRGRTTSAGNLRPAAPVVAARRAAGSPDELWSGRRESNPHLQFGNRRSAFELHPRDGI